MKNLIILLVFFAFITACKKTKTDPTSYTPKMAGAHTWHGIYRYVNSIYPSADTEYNITESFSILIMSNSLIAIEYNSTIHDTLRYVYAYDNIITFVRGIDAYHNNLDSISYNYISNYINYYEYVDDRNGGNGEYKLR